MIDKFNFYDVYGYFLPGAAVLLLLWLPFGLVKNAWPASDWSSAILGVTLAYFTGLLLQMICTKAIPSKMAKGQGDSRNPSDFVLDSDDSNLPKEFKTNLAALIKKKFNLDLEIDKSTKEVDKVRNAAFFMARHVLIRAKEVSYAEQFQGMYTLTRGLTAAFALATVDYVGWSLSVFNRGWVDCIVVVVIVVSLLVTDNFTAHLLFRKDLGKDTPEKLERWSARLLLLATMALGYGLGRRYEIMPTQAGVLFLCATGVFIACLRSYGAYKSFSITFAITVWRDFFSSTDVAGKGQATANKLDE